MKRISFINSYKSISLPVKAGLWFTICTIIQRGIQFLVVPIYTRILSAEGYGVYSLFITWMNILSILCTLNLSGGVYLNGIIKYENTSKQYTSSILWLGTFSSLIVFTIILIIYPLIERIIGLPLYLMPIMLVSVVVVPALNFWSYQQRIKYRYRKLVYVTIINALLTPIFSLTLVLCFNWGYNGVICGLTLSNFIICGCLYLCLCIQGKQILNIKYWKYSLKLSLPLIPHYLSQIILGQSDRIMIQYYCGMYYTGLYSLAYQVALILNLIITGINQALTPWLYNKLKEKQYDVIKRNTIQLCHSMLYLSIAAMMIAPELILIFGTNEYLEAVWAIPPVVASTCITFIYCIQGTILFYYEKTKLVAIATSSGAILNIILNIIFIPLYGYLSAAITTLVGYFVMYWLYGYYVRNVLTQNNIPSKILFDFKKSNRIVLVLLIITILSELIYLYLSNLRYIVLLLSLVPLVLNKNKIIKSIKA